MTRFLLLIVPALAFAPARLARPWVGRLAESASDEAPGALATTEKIGNLVADDEYLGLSMELAELVRTAVVEDLKKTTRELIGKDDYKIGDISKAVDAKVKSAVAEMRGKEECECARMNSMLSVA